MVVDFLPVLKHREEVKSTRDAERHPYFLFKNFGKYRENVGINRFCMYVEGNEDDHSHQPYAEADKRVRSEAGQIQAVRGESRRIRPVGRQPCRIHRCEVASRPRQDVQNGPRGGVPVPGDNTPRIIDDRAGKSYRVFCQVGVGRFGVSFSPCERRVSGRFGVGRSCWLLVIALVIA